MQAHRILARVCLLLLASFLAAIPGSAGDVGGLDLRLVAQNLGPVVAISHAGDDRLFLTVQSGEILIYQDGLVLPQPFLDISGRVAFGGERGLLGLAFHPGFVSNGFFYVNYTDNGGDTVIARYSLTADPNRVDAGSEAVLLRVDQPFSNHNGGQIQFGPDGFLYIGLGDGGAANDPQCLAQDNSSLLGKMLRLDVNQNIGNPPFHGIPASNPFVGNPDIRDEIWATGLRNPWRFSFDRASGALYIGDVGQNAREEINQQPVAGGGGRNYGWKIMEANLCLGSTAGCGFPIPPCNAPDYTPPIIEYGRAGGRCAVIGGYVYRGQAIPGLAGTYLYGDFCSGDLLAATPQGNQWVSEPLPVTLPQLTSFGEDADGEIYLTANGSLFELIGPGAPPPPPMPGSFAFASGDLEAQEDAGSVTVTVERSGGTDGGVSVSYRTRDGSATAGSDYVAATGELVWEAGDGAAKTFEVQILDNNLLDGDRFLDLLLESPTGDATLGSPSEVRLTIRNEDVDNSPCVTTPTTLCLQGDRFEVSVDWRIDADRSGQGEGEELTADTAWFYFFNETNVELVVKVLDNCNVRQRFWVFAAGLTNVEVNITVRDTQTGDTRTYRNPSGAAFDPIQDTDAFATCP